MTERLEQLGHARFDGQAFGLRVRLALARANLSLRKAAAEIEVDQANLHRVAKHGKPPCVETYLRLCEWLEKQEVEKP